MKIRKIKRQHKQRCRTVPKDQPSHQNGSEDSGADAICHLKLSFVIGSCEVVVPPRTKHPENKWGRASWQFCSFLHVLLCFKAEAAHSRCWGPWSYGFNFPSNHKKHLKCKTNISCFFFSFFDHCWRNCLPDFSDLQRGVQGQIERLGTWKDTDQGGAVLSAPLLLTLLASTNVRCQIKRVQSEQPPQKSRYLSSLLEPKENNL